MLVRDASFGVHDERLRYAIDAPIDSDAPVAIDARARVRIAERVEPVGGIVGRILVVQAVNRHDFSVRKLEQQRMFFPARDAPRGKDIHERYFAFEIGAREAKRTTLYRREPELWHRLADERRRNLMRIVH